MESKIKRCLLFVPSAFTNKKYVDINPMPPLGLGYIAGVMEKLGVEVKIVDCLLEGWRREWKEVGNGLVKVGLSDEEIEGIIENFSPDMVGVNSLFSRQYKHAHDIYRIVKSINKDIITVAGGAHSTVMPEFELHNENLDFVVIGEGEFVIEELVRSLSENIEKIRNIEGLGYKDNGKIVINPKISFIKDLDSIPFPARHLMNMEGYFGLEMSHGKRRYKRFSPIVTSRGCPAKCTFCTAYKVWGRRYRYRSAENVIEEMKELKNKYNIEELLIEDDSFTSNMERAEKICDLMIEENLNFKWDTPNGIAAFHMNTKLIEKMQAAGCYQLNIGVESGNQHVLNKIIKKPLKLSKVEEIVRHAKKIGLNCGLYFIVGMPGVTLEGMWDNYRFARKVKVFDPFISVATPYPGSELYDVCKEKSYIPENFKLDDLYIRSFIIETEDWTQSQLKSLMRKGYVYLKFFQALDNPILFSKLFIKWSINRYMKR